MDNHHLHATIGKHSSAESGVTVLLAEDNKVSQQIASVMLKSLGCDVDIVCNGEDAVQAHSRKKYDLVLMDYRMPGTDGLEATTRIRDMEEAAGIPPVPIIALTVSDDDRTRNACLAVGMDDFLSKPLKKQDLERKLAHWLMVWDCGLSSTHSQTRAIESTTKKKTLDGRAIERMRELEQETGSDILARTINHFLQQAPKDMNAVREALKDQDRKRLGFLAHNLKYYSATLGATKLTEQCRLLEKLSQAGSWDELMGLARDMDKNMPPTMDALREALEKQTGSSKHLASLSRTSHRERLLIVDDDQVFRKNTRDILSTAGYEVLEAAYGTKALSLALRHQPDLVLLDAVMENMDGYEVCTRMLKFPSLSDIPVIMVTGLDNHESVEKAYAAGASGFIIKPVNYPQLLQHIRFQLRASQNAKKLLENQEKLLSAQRMAGLGYWRWDSRADSLEISENLAAMLNLPAEEQQYSLDRYLAHVHSKDRNYLRSAIIATTAGDRMEPFNYQLVVKGRPNITVHQELEMAPNSTQVLLGTVQDITQKQATERRMHQLTTTDELTGLASRTCFYEYMTNTIHSAEKHQREFALLCLDLDGFKDINDSLGHNVGDKLLKAVARRLQCVVRETDFLARVSGDEFFILINEVNQKNDAAEVARRSLLAINRPVVLSTGELRPRCSIGIARYPKDGRDLHTLIKAADSAMYAAKNQGKHRYVFYEKTHTREAEQRLRMEQDLRRAIELDQLTLYYQPQIDLKQGKIVGVEALIRWQHPERGLIPPDQFIDLAEQIGMIRAIGDWVLKTACKQVADWQEKGVPELRMAVNISPLHFNDPSLLPAVESILEETGLSPSSLELEITENVVQTTENNIGIFQKLRDLGVRISIDDFGTGYSSLASLKSLPIDSLKIDRVFISNMFKDTNSTILLHSIVDLAHALGYLVVAEGVEQDQEVDVLRKTACDLVQGYLFSKPVPPEHIPQLATQHFMAGSKNKRLAACS
ncbi:EAL domain-containing protein [Thiolapillus brandeum]|uniref:cyclic-guanylate-specific phosphodiesterase n=1 Tax=Thiolapillus brandeum TaxID=1076588 RepID=A0A7U6GIK9_9GAMM|nr:EAL domain-containing protein [Thiolapillus brandeum]BAO44311.1 signal transduction response regulator, GGDEF/EAL containing [Thiolapillus brandeum]